MTLPISLAELAYAAVVVLLAAVVRGYSGFGFALLTVPSLTVMLAPARIIPVLFLLELAAGINLIPQIWRQIHWRSIAWIFPGAVVATPIGVHLLATVPAAPMTLGIAAVVLVTVALLWHGFALKTVPGPAPSFATGMASGFLNGTAGIGGPPVILFYFSSPAAAAVGRASLILYFFAIDLLALLLNAEAGLVNSETIVLSLALLPPLVLGIWLGNRRFLNADPVVFRKMVLLLLVVLALVSGGKAALELWGQG